MRPIPLLPTLIVGAAIAAMLGLGIWQLQRAEWKEELLAELQARNTQRRASISCAIDAAPEVRAGRSAAGESGYRYLVPCGGAILDIGWSRRPDLLPRMEASRTFTGTYEPGDTNRILVLDQPLPPLGKSALPSAADLPNNHRLYAAQWFFFAFAAALIYALALRRRRRELPGPA